MKLPQTQLMLIVDNIGLPTPNRATVYDEVMNIWVKAMVMTDRLIGGMAQSVQNADDLLGLCAWHIYPDLYVISTKANTIEQKDSLVKKGGLLTIGLRNSREADLTGVSWSMPLAHLRFYGKPVMSRQVIGSMASRVPFHRGIQVILGALTSEWQSSLVDLANVAKFLILFADSLEAGMKNVLDNRDPLPTTAYQSFTRVRTLSERYDTFADIGSNAYWPSMLSLQAQEYLHSSEMEQGAISRYFALGRRRYGNALGKAKEHPSPHFGLSDTGLYIRLTAPDKRVLKLREMAGLFASQLDLKRAIIRLTHPQDSLGYQMTEYATVFPQAIEGTSHRTHRRWIILPNTTHSVPGNSSARLIELQLEAIERSMEIMRNNAEPCGFLLPDSFIALHNMPTFQGDNYDSKAFAPAHPVAFHWLERSAPLSLTYLMDQMTWADHILPAKQRAQGWRIGHSKHIYGDNKYYYLYGDNSKAAVYTSTLAIEDGRPDFDYVLPADYIIRALENGDLDSVRFMNHFIPDVLPHLMDTNISAYFQSLISFAHAGQIYATLPQAEVSLNVFTKTLCESHWAQALLTGTHRYLSRTTSLACASLFDTGYLDLQIKDLEDVLAVSSGNSIYASEFLFCDPSLKPPKHHLRHVIGNVGKPGLALLLSPRDTVLREPDLETWQLVNHAKFDGCFEDNFASTTLHLSLTGYEQRLNTSRYGCRDKEAFYLEAVVSAYEKGTWVADLDLLHLIHGPFLRVESSCMHNTNAQQDFSIFPCLTSIDNWYEYLDRPPNTAVIRASGNWVARLALAAIPLAGKEALIIGSERICWTCLDQELRVESFPERLILC